MSRLDSLAKGAKLGLRAFARWGNGTDGTTTQEYQANQLEQNDDKSSANLNIIKLKTVPFKHMLVYSEQACIVTLIHLCFLDASHVAIG